MTTHGLARYFLKKNDKCECPRYGELFYVAFGAFMHSNQTPMVTVFTSSETDLNKTLFLKNSVLDKRSNSDFYNGLAQAESLLTLKALGELILNLESNQAIGLGLPTINGDVVTQELKVTTREKLSSKNKANTVARTKDFFTFPRKQPAFMLFDIDKRNDRAGLTKEEVLQQLHEIDPKLKTCGHLIVPSSSSFIYSREGNEIVGAAGWHVYVMVDDASLIPDYGKWFEVQAWLKGYGYILISQSGSQLPRNLVDSAVFSPERLVFESAPTLKSGLTSNKPYPEVVRKDVMLALTKADVQISPDKQKQFDELVAEAKAETKEEAETVRGAYIEKRANTLISCTPNLTIEQAKEEVLKSLETSDLTEHFVLKRDDGLKITVKDILANIDEYDQKTFYDPYEWSEGRNRAKLFSNPNGCVILHSQLHGGQKYFLRHAKNKSAVRSKAVKTSNEFAIRRGDPEDEEGLYYKSVNKDGDETWTRIGGAIAVKGLVTDESDSNYKIMLEFNSSRGRKHISVPASLLEESRKFLAQLRDNGYEICSVDGTPNKKLLQYINEQQYQNQSNVLTQVKKTGWHNDSKSFVLPMRTIGEASYIFDAGSNGDNPYKQSGTVDEWKQNIGRFCVGNPNLIVAVCVALAGALVSKAGTVGGLHFYGDSSTGKTTLLSVASSVFGDSTYLRTWRATHNGIEAQNQLFNDFILVLDEMSQCNPSEIGDIIYMLGNGVGKGRAKKDLTSQEQARFQLVTLSSGEKTVSEFVSSAGRKATAGQAVRLIEIPVKQKYGAFNKLHGKKDGAELSKHFKTAIQKYHGEIGIRWIETLLANTDDMLNLRETLNDCFDVLENQQKTALNSEEKRGLSFFVLLAFAGEYATKHELTGWSEGDAVNAVEHVFKLWREHNGMAGTASQEDATIIKSVKDFIDKHQFSRFAKLRDDESTEKVLNCVGRIKIKRGGMKQYLFHEAGLTEAAGNSNLKKVCEVLAKAGLLLEEKTKEGKRKGFTISHTIDEQGHTTRFYTIERGSIERKTDDLDSVF